MDTLKMQKSQHSEAEELFAQLQDHERVAAKRRIVEELADRLAVQAKGVLDHAVLVELARELIVAQAAVQEIDGSREGAVEPHGVVLRG
jgi:hypothetical protein